MQQAAVPDRKTFGLTPRETRIPKERCTYPVQDAIFEINLHASRNVLDPLPMIDLGEVDANLQWVCVRASRS